MGGSTEAIIREVVVLSLLALLFPACAVKTVELEQVYREGYRELEWGNLEAAEAIAREGLRRAREEQRQTRARAFGILEAEVLVAQRRIEEALERLDANLIGNRSADILRARALMTRGYARCFLPDEEEAKSRSEADLEEAARIAATLGAEKIVAEVTIRRGTCSFRRNDFDSAESEFREAMAMARSQGLPLIEAQAAGSLGRIRVLASQFDDATRWLRRSLDVVSNRAAEGLRLKTLDNLGWCYVLLGDYKRAIQVLSEADALARRFGYAGDRVPILFNLGQALHGEGDYAGAHRAYVRAAAVANEIRNRNDAAELLAQIHVTQATLALEQGHLDGAALQAEEALRIQSVLDHDADRQRTLLLQGEIWERRGNRSRAAELYGDVIESPYAGPDLRWEARAAIARLHVQADRPAEAEKEFRRAFELMEASLAQSLEAEHRLPFVANLGRFYDEYVDFLVAQGRVTEALQTADDSRARLLQERLLGAGTGPASDIDYRSLARDLNAPLLFYWTAPERSFLWTVTADGVELVPLPEEEALEALVTAYQERIFKSRDPIREADPEGGELYRLLFQPVLEAVAAAERVVIVADGPLHQLNFESLVAPDPEPHYLIEDVTLERTPSLRLLSAKGAAAKDEAPSLLVLGDPISPSDEFPSLPFAGREIASIAELFAPENRRIYSRARANRSAYLSADPERFGYIHFAAHAQANPVVPLDSAVVLSARGDDYKLYAREIVNIPLDAELVTLSACRSAGGRTFAGEGLVGLSWAFLSAGARNVIGGLWPVEDASTAELMTHLYHELAAGAEPAVALRRAKLELLRSGTAYRKPYYWAPFVVYASRAGGSRQ